jgi:hypothetical protein
MFYFLSCQRTLLKLLMVLQTCTNSPKTPAALGSEMYLTSSKDACGAICIKVEEDEYIDLKEEGIPEPIIFPTVKTEEDVVSYKAVCPEVDTFSQCANMPAVFVICIPMSVHIRQLCC